MGELTVIRRHYRRTYMCSMLSPRVGGGGIPWEIDSSSFSMGGDLDIWVLPWSLEFDIAIKDPFWAKSGTQGWELKEMSNSLVSAQPPSLGLNIDMCIGQKKKMQVSNYPLKN